MQHNLLKIFTITFIWLFSLTVNGQVLFHDFEKPDTTGLWKGDLLKDSVYAFSGKYSAFADSLHPYGTGVNTLFPDGIRHKNCRLKVEGKVLSGNIHPDALYVVTLQRNGKTIFWKGIPLSGIINEKEKWYSFSDSIKIPANISGSATLKTYLWNAGRKGKIYLDDLKFTFERLKTPSFIADIKKVLPADTITDDLHQILFSNRYFAIVKTPSGNVFIASPSGEILAGNITFLINDKNHSETLNRFTVKTKEKNGKSRIILKTASKTYRYRLTLDCSSLSPAINFSSEVKFKKAMRPARVALSMDYRLPLKAVYKYDRKCDTADFEDEYWLDKEGVLLKDSLNSLAIYHNTGLSSLQLDVPDKVLVLNLDYENDHHYERFPLLPDTFDVKIDESKSRFDKKAILSNNFKVFIGTATGNLPVFMKNPDGFLATYIWTEHADWTDIRTHRATYFGSEKITVADSATGGFVKYNIPVTKSVFYDNPDSISNTEGSHGLFNTPEESIKADTAFFDFLVQLKKYGHEICLHSPDHYTTTPVLLNEALSFMKKHFDSSSWIDHGYNNLPENNREDFVCDGVFGFASDLWKEFGIRYFWEPYQEDFSLYSGWSFDNSIEKLYSGFGNSFPRPDYWLHPTMTKDFYHWPTPNVMYIEKENLWGYYFSDYRLNDFVENWSLEINHCYPAWTYPGKGFWKYDTDSAIVAMDGFNRTLSKMAALKQKKLLNVTTIEDYLNYRTAVDKLEYSVLPDGRIKVTNSSGKEIKGLSMTAKASAVTVNDLKPAQKMAGDQLVFWFDLGAYQSVLIRLVE